MGTYTNERIVTESADELFQADAPSLDEGGQLPNVYSFEDERRFEDASDIRHCLIPVAFFIIPGALIWIVDWILEYFFK
ncbi:MAG: hypothetical protein AAB787_02560 [Patescibacteria group bacterium]